MGAGSVTVDRAQTTVHMHQICRVDSVEAR